MGDCNNTCFATDGIKNRRLVIGNISLRVCEERFHTGRILRLSRVLLGEFFDIVDDLGLQLGV